MTSSCRRQGHSAIGLTIALVTLTAATMAAPSTAGAACPSWYTKAKSFHGVLQYVKFNQSATGPDGIGGSETVSLARNGAKVSVPPLRLQPKTHHRDFSGFSEKTLGGKFVVDDHYSDTMSGQTTKSADTANAAPINVGAQVTFNPGDSFGSGCGYVLSFSFGVTATSPSDGWPYVCMQGTKCTNDVSLEANTGLRRVTARQKLSGHATVNAYCGTPRGPIDTVNDPWYGVDGVVSPGANAWQDHFCDLRGYFTKPVGTATFSWTLQPTLPRH